jgi:DNA-binding NarL/FixJ family response regulator
MKEPDRYKIVIIDPSVIFSEGLSKILNADPECKVIACYSDYDAFIGNPRTHKIDIILFNPITVSPYKKFFIKNVLHEYKNTSVIALLYSYVTPEAVAEYDGYIDIFEKSEDIIHKIKLAVENRSGQQADSYSGEGIELSDREKEILISVAQGMTNKEIAEKHHISIHTVISHRKNISRKTGIKTVSGLTVYAMLNNLMA